MLRRTRTELIETIERSRAIYSLLGLKYNETEKMWRAILKTQQTWPINSAFFTGFDY